MAETPRTLLKISAFKGMATNPDSSDLQPGVAELQVNVNGMRQGMLEVRRGLREIVFEESDDE